MIDPKALDKAICDWSVEAQHNFTDHEQASLLSMIFNQLCSDNNVHTMPNDNTHLETEKCWCDPILTYEDEETHVKHYTHMDTRKEALN
jgi:hypothetical protein